MATSLHSNNSRLRRKLFIVVRYGRLDDFDAITEIEKVISKKKKAWFGKYGQPLSRGIERLTENENEEVYVVLVRKSVSGEPKGYQGHFYRLKSVSREAPTNHTEFPAYYRQTLNRIGYWFEIEPYKGPRFDLKNLVTRSSLQPLLQSLGSSMRGHFLCRLREGN